MGRTHPVTGPPDDDPPRTPDGPARPRTVHLTESDLPAVVERSDWDGGWVLRIGGIEQSHVDLADPSRISHEYLRRIAAAVDTVRPRGEPLTIAHLGGGALTLVRYVQATRPDSEQLVIELERELVSFVVGALPLPAGTRLEVVVGDARDRLREMPGRLFDVVVLDVFSGEASPPHLAAEEFYVEALEHLEVDGLLLVNVGDDAGQHFIAAQAAALEAASVSLGLPGVWMLTAAALVERGDFGNYVLLAGGALAAADIDEQSQRWWAAGPHPAAVLDPEETARFVWRRGR